MTDARALLNAITLNPDDDTIRLVYADWLEEHDDPERAEFIRIQITLARHSDGLGELLAADVARMESREQELLNKNTRRWLQSLDNLTARGMTHGRFWRGFVDGIVIDARVFIEDGEELWRDSPVGWVEIKNLARLGPRLSRCPHLARVRCLQFCGERAVTITALRSLLESPYLANLRRLSLDELNFRDKDVATLVQNLTLPYLRELGISRMRMQERTLRRVLACFPQLTGLCLVENQFAYSACRELFDVPTLISLKWLCVSDECLGLTALRHLLDNRRFPELSSLVLDNCGLDTMAFHVMSKTTNPTQITTLDLRSTPLTVESCNAFAAWSGLRTIRTLKLDYCHLDPRGLDAIVRSPHLGQLNELSLSCNRIGDAGADTIANCAGLTDLRILKLDSNDITQIGASALAGSPNLNNLRQIDLRRNNVGSEGESALHSSEQRHPLRRVRLGPDW
ncbi:MAG: TIGR02996 domain-containing protein [Planctomycetes bacterium]|nr:TIGR02996 domain-containing protein [Planctomycetota bacterium]